MSDLLDPWRILEIRLAAFVSTMLDPTDRLELVVPGAEGTPLSLGREAPDAPVRVRLLDGTERSGPPGEVAALVRQHLAVDRAVPHPALLTVTAAGPAAGGVGVLGLTAASLVGADVVAEAPLETPPVPRDAAALRALVLDHVARTIDPAVQVDDDGDIRFVFEPLRPTHGEVGGYLRVPEGEPVPVIGLFAVLVQGVTSPGADLELNVLNRKYRWSRWVRYGEHVVQELSVPAAPFDPALLDALLGVFFSDLVHVCVDLADRVGGTLTT